MPDKLLPCPFCGSSVTVANVARPWQTDAWAVTCEKCYQRFFFRDTEKEAVELWNTRPADSALRSACRALVEKWRDRSRRHWLRVSGGWGLCAVELEAALKEAEYEAK